MTPPHGRIIKFKTELESSFTACLLNSSLFYWYYSSFSDCEHINDKMVRSFAIPENWNNSDWQEVNQSLLEDMASNSTLKTIKTKEGHVIDYDELNAAASKSIINDIDRILAKHYGFTDEELDFIINYDIKYRMGING